MLAMGPIMIAEPFGLLGLLGVPITLLLFLFHRQSKRVQITTLFLIAPQTPEDFRGRRIERLRNSLPLWMTLLCVLLLTSLLSKPTIISRELVQRIVVVLDSSVSMRAFLPVQMEQMKRSFKEIQKLSSITEWVVIESAPHKSPLYEGRELSGVEQSLAKWNPDQGTHSSTIQLEFARSIAGELGSVLFVTDRRSEVPEGVLILGIGSPIDNAGFVGSAEERTSDGRGSYSILLRNYSNTPQRRSLFVGDTLIREINFAPEELLRLELSDEIDVVTAAPKVLRLTSDQFPIDDVLLLLRPQRKPLSVSIQSRDAQYAQFRKILGIDDSIVIVGADTKADVEVGRSVANRGDTIGPAVFVAPPRAASDLVSQLPITSLNFPLTEGLQFEGINLPPCRPYSVQRDERVLVWQGDTPMVVTFNATQLYLNFDPLDGQAARHPAVVALLHRFLASVRKQKADPETKSFDGGQLIELPELRGEKFNITEKSFISAVSGTRELSGAAVRSLRAPVEPSFFTVALDGRTILTGVSNFADTREGDFLVASSFNPEIGRLGKQAVRSTQRAPFENVWLLLALIAAILSWVSSKDLLALFRRLR